MAAQERASAGAALRIVGIASTVVFGALFLLFAFMALGSRFGGAFDPHGYALIFGTLIALVLAIPTAVSIPLIFSPGHRLLAGIFSLVGFLIVEIGLLAALLTA